MDNTNLKITELIENMQKRLSMDEAEMARLLRLKLSNLQ